MKFWKPCCISRSRSTRQVPIAIRTRLFKPGREFGQPGNRTREGPIKRHRLGTGKREPQSHLLISIQYDMRWAWADLPPGIENPGGIHSIHPGAAFAKGRLMNVAAKNHIRSEAL